MNVALETVHNFSSEMLDQMMPMHIMVSEDGRVFRVGPTLAKLHPELAKPGARFLDVFELRRPRGVETIQALRDQPSNKLSLCFRNVSETNFKGIFVAMPTENRLLINLSFGISVVDAVAHYKLTAADFAVTDLTIEMLYLVEAKTAVMEESRKLNKRLQGAKIAAEEQAFTDTLTGLKNRRALDHVLERLISAGNSFAMLHLDLDFFKEVNDTLGHAAGDHVLQVAAKVLVAETRHEDLVARVGGDEFILIFTTTTDPKRLESIAERIIRKLEAPVNFNGHKCKISGSIGITLSSLYETPDAVEMLADADTALYASKHKGRAVHTLFDFSMRSEA